MGPIRSALALVGALVIGVAACSSSSEVDALDLGKAESEIRTLADKAYGGRADIGPVQCPRKVPVQKGLLFVCTVAIDGAPLAIRVRQTDAKGNVNIEQAQAVILRSKAEEFVSSYAEDRGSPASEVSCGGRAIIIRAPGKKISCTVEFADGATGVAALTVRDTSGKVALNGIEPTTS